MNWLDEQLQVGEAFFPLSEPQAGIYTILYYKLLSCGKLSPAVTVI